MEILKEFIKDLLNAGKSDREICDELDKQPDLIKDLKAEQVVEMIEEVEKSIATKTLINEKEKKKLEDEKAKEFEKNLEKKLEEKLKSINIVDKTYGGKINKVFNFKTGKLEEETVQRSEAYKKCNDLMIALLGKDEASAYSISKEIEAENKKDQTAQRTDDNASGGYAIPTEVDNEIHQLVYNQAVMLGLFTIETNIFQSKLYPTINGIEVVDIPNQTKTLEKKLTTFKQAGIDMYRVGAYTPISNNFLEYRGVNIVNAFTIAYASAFARYIDLRSICGSTAEATADALDGIIYQAAANLAGTIALNALGEDDVRTLRNAISNEATGKRTLVGNLKVMDQLGMDENTGGQNYFPQYINGGSVSPFGIPFKLNEKIPSTLEVTTKKRTTGTDDVLLLGDFSKIIFGMTPTTRIDMSKDVFFLEDQMVMRGIKKVAWNSLFDSGQVLQFLRLTN